MLQGQEKISKRILESTLDEFPRTLMLVGPSGSGKKQLCKMISERFNLTTLDITTTLTLETIEQIYDRVEPYLYLIRVNEISIKEENTILKFLEEPLRNSYIVLLAETEMGILQTILNRCQIWYLQNYSKEYLKTFIGDGDHYILEIATTPGQVKELVSCDFKEMLALADKIIDKIHLASVSNTLSLSSKLKFKDEADKLDLNLFIQVLSSRIVTMCHHSAEQKYTRAYLLTKNLKENLAIKNLDNRALFENYLIDLRAVMRGALV